MSVLTPCLLLMPNQESNVAPVRVNAPTRLVRAPARPRTFDNTFTGWVDSDGNSIAPGTWLAIEGAALVLYASYSSGIN